MAKAMIFVDGTWLYRNVPRLAQAYGNPDFHIDFGKLPAVLAEVLEACLGGASVDVVRTYLFGSFADNYDSQDEDIVQRRLDFFSRLKEDFHYEVETFPINFRGRRVRAQDRDPHDTFEPKEKCVDISLATSMLYYAAIPHAYDIAVAVVGDQDFKPVLQHLRRLGKRVAIASIKGSCSPDYSDPRDPSRIKDFDIVWLDDLLHRLELKFERHQLECESPLHAGDKRVWTTFHPRAGQRFFCDECRTRYTEQKHEVEPEWNDGGNDDAYPEDRDSTVGQTLSGQVKKIVADRGFGFIDAGVGEFFYHLTDLEPGLSFESIAEGDELEFEVKRDPGGGKAGAAQAVRRS